MWMTVLTIIVSSALAIYLTGRMAWGEMEVSDLLKFLESIFLGVIVLGIVIYEMCNWIVIPIINLYYNHYLFIPMYDCCCIGGIISAAWLVFIPSPLSILHVLSWGIIDVLMLMINDHFWGIDSLITCVTHAHVEI